MTTEILLGLFFNNLIKIGVKMARNLDSGSSHKKKRPGVVSKCKTSTNKNSKHYIKAYKGQGR